MCDSNKNKNKSKSKCKSVAPEEEMLKSDAVPSGDSSIFSNDTQLRNENDPPQQKFEPDRNAKNEEMGQNYKNPLDQNATIFGTLHNLSINNCTGVHFGNIFNMGHSYSQKDCCDRNHGNRAKVSSKPVIGTR